MPTITYPDTLYVDALLRDMSIMVMVFLFKTGYAQPTLPDEVVEALIEAQARGAATALHKVSNEVSIALMP